MDATIRGVANGIGDDNKAMGGNLNVNADTISRISMNVQAFQNKLTDGHGNELNSKDTGISVAVNYGEENNDAIATLGGDIKVAGDVQVKADSVEKITSLALQAAVGGEFAGAGAANAHDVDVDTLAWLGKDDKDNSDAQEELCDYGNEGTGVGQVSVLASDDVNLKINAAQGSFAGNLAGGLSIGVAVVDKNVQAMAENVFAVTKGMRVDAQNLGYVLTTANGVAASGTGALAGSAAETIVEYNTDAHIGPKAMVDTVRRDANGKVQGEAAAHVNAKSSFEHVGEAAGIGGAGSNTDIRYTSNTDISSAAHLETANGDIRMAAGADSKGNEQHIFARADGYIVNATLVPISIYPNPSVTVTNNANINISPSSTSTTTPDIASDRSIYLTANEGSVTTVADGSTRDWINNGLNVFGFTACDSGTTKLNAEGNVKVDGRLEAGIHRNQNILIGGINNNGVWETEVLHTAGMAYEYDANSSVSTDMLARLANLQQMRSNYSQDSAAFAAYFVEIQALEEKLINAGFGCREKNGVFVAYVEQDNAALATGKITVQDLDVHLGNIAITADNLYGSGSLVAADTAEVNIINNSPNNLVVNNITVNSAINAADLVADGGNVSYTKYDNGAKISYNGVVLTKVEDIKSKNKDSTLYNPYGAVSITSAQGDIFNEGSIYADSVHVQASNGDFVQSYSERLTNVGGQPENELTGSSSTGIRANGNIYIAARYVNVNAPIVSGQENITIHLPNSNALHFYYSSGGKEIDVTNDVRSGAAKNWTAEQIASRTIYLKDDNGKIINYVTYDIKNEQLVVDDIEFRGGNVTIVGTIMNTNTQGKGSITAFDGYGNVIIVNDSGYKLSLGNISTGDGTEGIIKLVDLDSMPTGTYVSKGVGSGMTLGANGVCSSTKTYTTSTSNAYDVSTTSYRKWYELGTVKHYETRYKIKTGTTTITSHAIAANNKINIGFIGQESNSQVVVQSETAVKLDGVINNQAGDTVINVSGGNIQQCANGYINTENLNLRLEFADYSYGIGMGTTENPILFSANQLNVVSDADVYLESVGMQDLTVKDAGAENGIFSLKAEGSILGGNYKADSLELVSTYGSVGSASQKATLSMQNQGIVKVDAQGDIYLENTTDKLYVDHIISQKGDVSVITAGDIIDVNTTDKTDVTAAEKLKSFARAQLLAGEASTAEKQKGMLCAKVDNKYNRFQTLSQNVENGKFVLSDAEKATLTELGQDAAAYAAACQSEYDALVAAGVDKWTAEGVAQYKESINNSTDSIFANASVTKEQLSSDSYLTQAEKAEVLVGSCYTDRDLLLVIGNNSDKNVTDTNYLIKDVPNIQGKNVTLQSGGSIGHQAVLSGIDLNKDISQWTEDELLALGAAEAKDITITDGKATISLVKPIVVEADKVTATAGKDLYLATEGSFTDSSFISTNGGDMRLKAADSLANIQLKGATSYLLEAAKGSISGIEFAEEEQRSSTPITARAMQDITLMKKDLTVENVYSEQGKVSLTSSGTITGGTVRAGGDIAMLGCDVTLDAVDSQQNVRMEAENVRVLGLSAGQGVFGKVDQYIQIYDIKAGHDVQLFNLEGRQIRLGDIEAGGKVSVTLNDNTSDTANSLTIESIVAKDTINIYGYKDVTVGSARTDKDLRLYTNTGFIKMGDAWASQFYIEPAELDRYHVGSYNGVKNYKFIYHQGAYEGNEKGGFGEFTGAGYEWYPEFRAATNTAPYGSQTMPSIDVVVAEEGQLTSGNQSNGVGASPTIDSSELQRAGVGGSQVASGSAGLDGESLAAILSNPPQEEQNAEGRRQEDTEIVIQ